MKAPQRYFRKKLKDGHTLFATQPYRDAEPHSSNGEMNKRSPFVASG
jgi:hypothetical protein